MTYTIGWSEGEATVTTPAEAEAVLEQLAADPRGPFLVHVAPDNGSDALIELVYGQADRAMLTYTDDAFGGTATDPDLPPAGELHYDYGTVDPDRSRLTRTRASRAVAEFVATGARPSGLSWQE